MMLKMGLLIDDCYLDERRWKREEDEGGAVRDGAGGARRAALRSKRGDAWQRWAAPVGLGLMTRNRDREIDREGGRIEKKGVQAISSVGPSWASFRSLEKNLENKRNGRQ